MAEMAEEAEFRDLNEHSEAIFNAVSPSTAHREQVLSRRL